MRERDIELEMCREYKICALKENRIEMNPQPLTLFFKKINNHDHALQSKVGLKRSSLITSGAIFIYFSCKLIFLSDFGIFP